MTDSNSCAVQQPVNIQNELLAAALGALQRCRRELLDVLITTLLRSDSETGISAGTCQLYQERLRWLAGSFCFAPRNARAWAAKTLSEFFDTLLQADTVNTDAVPSAILCIDTRQRALRILLRIRGWTPGDALNSLLCACVDDIIITAGAPDTGTDAGAAVWLKKAQKVFQRLRPALLFSRCYAGFLTHQTRVMDTNPDPCDFLRQCIALRQALSGEQDLSQLVRSLNKSLGETLYKALNDAFHETVHETVQETFHETGHDISKISPQRSVGNLTQQSADEVLNKNPDVMMTREIGLSQESLWLLIRLAAVFSFMVPCMPQIVAREKCERLITLCGLCLHSSHIVGSTESSDSRLLDLVDIAQRLAWGVPCQDRKRPSDTSDRINMDTDGGGAEDLRDACHAIEQTWAAHERSHKGSHKRSHKGLREEHDLQDLSLVLYRSAVIISLQGVDVTHQGLVCRIKSLWVSVNHCLQLGENACDFLQELTTVLRAFLADIRQVSQAHLPDPNLCRPLLIRILLMEARVGLHAQQYWEGMLIRASDSGLTLSKAGTVHEMLASGLHLLPRPQRLLGSLHEMAAQTDIAACGYPADTRDLLDEVMIELRMLAQGARVLGVPKVESLARIMIAVYQALLVNPVLLSEPGTCQLLVRAHRRLCFLLDQAAAWQAVTDGADILDRLCAWLDQRMDGVDYFSKPQSRGRMPDVGLTDHYNIAEDTHAWQDCRRYNQRLRRLLKTSEDLEPARVLLLELLRGQSAVIRRYLSYERHR